MSIHGGLSGLPGRQASFRSASWPARKPSSYACCIAAAIASLRPRRVQRILLLGEDQTLLMAVVIMSSAIRGSISLRMKLRRSCANRILSLLRLRVLVRVLLHGRFRDRRNPQLPPFSLVQPRPIYSYVG